MKQSDLFENVTKLPEGFRYAPKMISPAEEDRLVGMLKTLPFKEFEFNGFLGKRRVVSFGWRYDFTGGGLQKTEDMPGFLLPIRERAAAFAGLIPDIELRTGEGPLVLTINASTWTA